MRKILRRIAIPAAVSVAAVAAASLLGVSAADAHVTANSSTATQGGYGVVNLVVPNESESAPTTSLTVTLPSLNSARPAVPAGWRAIVAKDAQQKVTGITWTVLPGTAGVEVGQFAEFSFAGGPFPAQEAVSLPVKQVYGDGETVDWNQPTPADGTEPEHPAPELSLAPATTAGHHGATHESQTSESQNSGDSTMTTAAAQTDNNSALWLGGIGLVVGALGLVFGVAALMLVRRNGRGTGGNDDGDRK